METKIKAVKLFINAWTKWTWQTLLYTLIQAVALTFLWNFAIVPLITFAHDMHYTQAVGLLLMVKLLARSWARDSMWDTQIALYRECLYHGDLLINILQGILQGRAVSVKVSSDNNPNDKDPQLPPRTLN